MTYPGPHKLNITAYGRPAGRPLFKLLKAGHADALLSRGTVHFPTLFECRDAARYGGTTCDPTEGRGWRACSNQWLEAENCHIYCASSHLLSRSLEWALQEGKQSCVMIWDPERFFSAVNAALADEHHLVAVRPCLYVKSRKANLFQSGLVTFDQLVDDAALVPFLKPLQHESQLEIRALIKPRRSAEVSALTINVPAVREYLLPVNFSEVSVSSLADRNRRLGARLNLHKSSQKHFFVVAEPRESFSAVVITVPAVLPSVSRTRIAAT